MKRWRPMVERYETGKKRRRCPVPPSGHAARGGNDEKKAWVRLSHIVWPIFIAQYILAFFVYKLPGWPPLQAVGWGIWAISVIFGIAPIIILGLWRLLRQPPSPAA